jgi:hypothetical protein
VIPIRVDNGFRSPLFVLGDGRLVARANLNVQANCQEQTFDVRGQLTFNYNDRFRDPADIFDIIPGEVEIPGARVYALFDSWEVPIRVQSRRITF